MNPLYFFILCQFIVVKLCNCIDSSYDIDQFWNEKNRSEIGVICYVLCDS